MYSNEQLSDESRKNIVLVGMVVFVLIGKEEGDFENFKSAMGVFGETPVDCLYLMEDIIRAYDE